MILLPVLDLLDGIVVHAGGGQRDRYLPLHSSLASEPLPLPMVAGLLELYRFQHLYIADLDAIMGHGDNSSVVAAIIRNYPNLELWVDGGVASCKAVEYLLQLGVVRPVVGTETLPDLKTWEALRASPWAERLVLSLDYRGGDFLGPQGLEQQPELWSATVIAMNLDRVGSQKGPDWLLLERLRQQCLQSGEILVAGGVRNLDDLRQLAMWGAHGVLLASALYKGGLRAVELRQTE